MSDYPIKDTLGNIITERCEAGLQMPVEMQKRYALEAEKARLVAYAHGKLDRGDYHAVADAAMDLRELDVELRLLK